MAEARTRTQKWVIRIILVVLLSINSVRTFFHGNRYARYTFEAAQTISEDLKHYPGAEAKILSFLDRGSRIAYWANMEDLVVKENTEGPPFYTLRLNINYWKYAADVTYVIFTYPTDMPPPTPQDMLLKNHQWVKIHEAFIDNREIKKAYVFRYLPEKDEESSFETTSLLDNSDFEKVTSSIGFANLLMPMNPEFYSFEGNRVFPIDWNILPDYFMPGAKPEISCVGNALAGKYSLRLASENNIFVYSSHAVNIADDVYFSFEAIPKKDSLLNVWMMSAGERDQVNGCFYKKVAVIPFSEVDGNNGKNKYFFRMEPCLDGQNKWSRMAVELEYGEVILDNFQLERRIAKENP